MPLPQSNEYYTYADYASWDLKEGERYELIDGVPYMMAPPSRRHQELVGEIFGRFRDFLKDKPCKVYVSPFGVRLNAAGDHDDTVVEPDIVVVCDRSKLDDKGCNGAPDLVIEITSPSSARHDKLIKFQKYQNAGVREYWIVDPENKMVNVNILENGRYYGAAYSDTDSIPVQVLDGCQVDMREVFSEI